MDSHCLSRKQIAALVRQKRKKNLKERRSKKHKVNENDINNNEGRERYYAPSRGHISTPLYDITFAILNERNQNAHTQPIGSVLPTKKNIECWSYSIYACQSL